MRRPVRALITADAGYLLRDGDWYPWTTSPRQAAHMQVTLHSNQARTLATTPLRDGAATWDGLLPPALLVLPPTYEERIGGVTLAAGQLTPAQDLATWRAYATAISPVWARLDSTPPPRQIIALPYLAENLWVGDLLLVPENRAPTAAGVDEQNVLFGLIRSWMGIYRPGEPQTLVRVGPPGEPTFSRAQRLEIPPAGTRSTDPHGRWIETLDTSQAPPPPSLDFAVQAWRRRIWRVRGLTSRSRFRTA